MKKLSARQRVRLFRLQRKAAIRKRRRVRGAPQYRHAIRNSQVRWFNAHGEGIAYARIRTPMPANLCVEGNYEETAQILQRLRITLNRNLRPAVQRKMVPPKHPTYFPSYMDFSTMQRCSPAAALILASEFDRARALVDWSIPVINLDRWPPAILATLEEIGFFKLLGISHSRIPTGTPQSGQTVIQFMTGTTVSGPEADKLASTLAGMVFADMAEDADAAAIEARMTVYGPLVEAIENSIIHAYRGVGDMLTVRRWWMTGAVDPGQRHINIVVYDQGLSIPATLPTWAEWGWIQSHLARFWRRRGGTNKDDLGVDDAAKLRLAMRAPRSSTGQSNRGKGFPAFKEVLAGCRQGTLRIVSRRGEFLMNKGQKPAGRALKTPLTGTLVEWDLWL